MYEFKEEFRTGIEAIDKEHQKLFEIADRLYNTMMNEFIPDKYDYIVEVLNELRDYAATHFKHEEEYMVQIGYKRLFSQKIEHEKFIEKITEYDLDEVDENQRKVILELLEFLNDWLVNHIMESDKKIGMHS
ncbi:MAG: bacteriohemerythrin [Lachnospiraceae bacterium]|jgi:hemerythrin|nr:bacteriohemerythrin [Lachnospiraceae bacterium]